MWHFNYFCNMFMRICLFLKLIKLCLLLVALGLVALCGFSLVVANGGHFLVVVHQLLTAVAFLVADHALQGTLASVVARLGSSSAQAQQQCHTRLVTPRHAGSFQTSYRTSPLLCKADS